MWKRICSNCNKEVIHTTKWNRDRLQKTNKLCRECGIIKMSKTKKGKQPKHFLLWNKRGSKVNLTELQYPCPKCGKQRTFNQRWAVTRAKQEKTICNSCATKKYKKSWNYVIKSKHIKQMAATKAGFSTWSEYMKNLDKKKKYQRECRRLTRFQDISSLPNVNKLRGLNGVEGVYQLDHIISIDEGFSKNIPPEQIAALSNLQIIPWKVNIIKGNK